MIHHRDTKSQPEPLPPGTNDISGEIVKAVFEVHRALGPGLLESVYETCLDHELRMRGLRVQRQVAMPIRYRELVLRSSLRLDFLVEGTVVVEPKAVEMLLPVHKAQVLTYLKLSGYRLGLLINFNVPLIRDGIRRLIL